MSDHRVNDTYSNNRKMIGENKRDFSLLTSRRDFATISSKHMIY